jgi:DNA-binding CsgD family transcriptional regulator
MRITSAEHAAKRRGGLEVRAAEVLDRAAALTGELTGEPRAGRAWGESDGIEALERALDDADSRLREARDALGSDESMQGKLCSVLIELADLRDELRLRELDRRGDALQAVRRALSGLHGVTNVVDLMQKGVAEVCRNCDFDRAAIYRIEGSRLVMEAIYVEGDPDSAAKILAFAREHQPELQDMLVETEMLRRRAPILVPDARNDPRTFKPLVEFADARAYVAAPIMPEGRVIGFIHADRVRPAPPLDTVDRDTLWTFAEGFGFAIGRATLVSRLRSQRDQLRELMRSTRTAIDELTDSDIELLSSEHNGAAIAQTTTAMLVGADARIRGLLTRREIEVMELMAQGATNAGIADRLVIAESTAKHHVKSILRKLHAANRAEAVSRYLRVVGTERG